MNERLIYTNSAGQSIEMSTSSMFHVNIRKDVTGLSTVRNTLYRSQVVDVDGEIETGFHVETRDIDISGDIKSRNHIEQDENIRELQRVFSPFYTGVLRYESDTTKEIDVRVLVAPNVNTKVGYRWLPFTISLEALNPNWRETAELTKAIVYTGTEIYYYGSKACGLEITITATGDAVDIESLTITNGDNVETVTFRTAGDVTLDTDDVIVLDTTPGSISIQLNDVDAWARIDHNNTIYPRLYPGTNTITWLAYGDEADFTVSVAYTPLYIGA
jgi:phage-related protein